MTTEIKEYGIVLLLDNETTKQALKLNQQIATKLKNLENVANIWHVTLYHGAFATQDLEQIFHKLRTLHVEPVNIKFTIISKNSMGYIHWDIEKNLYIQELHTMIVNLASPFHKRPLQMSLDFYDDLSSTQQLQIDSFGATGLFDLYTPHMTLFYQALSEAQLDAILPDVAITTPHNGTAVKLVIGELGYGNIVKVLYDLPI